MNEDQKQEQNKKNIEVVLYISQHLQNITIKKLKELCYHADLEHILLYGRFITGRNLQNGFAPNEISKLLKDGNTETESDFIVVNDKIIPKRKPDTNEFSDSDVSCMNSVINGYFGTGYSKLPVLPRPSTTFI